MPSMPPAPPSGQNPYQPPPPAPTHVPAPPPPVYQPGPAAGVPAAAARSGGGSRKGRAFFEGVREAKKVAELGVNELEFNNVENAINFLKDAIVKLEKML